MSINLFHSVDSPGNTSPAHAIALPEAPAPMQTVNRVAHAALICRTGASCGDMPPFPPAPPLPSRMSIAETQDKLIRAFIKNSLRQPLSGEFLLKILNQVRYCLRTYSPDDSPLAALLASLVTVDAECFAKALVMLHSDKYDPKFLCPHKSAWKSNKPPICSFLEKWVKVFLKLDSLGQKNGLHLLAWYLQKVPLDSIDNSDLPSFFSSNFCAQDFFNELLKNMNPAQFETAELSTLVNFALCIFRSRVDRKPLTAHEIRLIAHLLSRPGACLQNSVCQMIISLEDHGLLWNSALGFNFRSHFPFGEDQTCFDHLFILSKYHPNFRLCTEEKIAISHLLKEDSTQLLFFALATAYYTGQEFVYCVDVFINSLKNSRYSSQSHHANNATRFKCWVIQSHLKRRTCSARAWHLCYSLIHFILSKAYFREFAPLSLDEAQELLELIKSAFQWMFPTPAANYNQLFGTIQELTFCFEAIHVQLTYLTPSYLTLIPLYTLYPPVLLYLGREAQTKPYISFEHLEMKKVITFFITTAERANLLESLGYIIRQGFRLTPSTEKDIYNLLHDEEGNLYPFTPAEIPQIIFAIDILYANGLNLSPLTRTLYSQQHTSIARRQLGH